MCLNKACQRNLLLYSIFVVYSTVFLTHSETVPITPLWRPNEQDQPDRDFDRLHPHKTHTLAQVVVASVSETRRPGLNQCLLESCKDGTLNCVTLSLSRMRLFDT